MSKDYLLQMVRNHHRDRFLQALFVPEPARGRLLALLALDAELAHVRLHVREEMLGHIRYAWWEEAVVAIADGKAPREHPVLQAIRTHQLAALALPLVQRYRETYPDDGAEHVVDMLVASLITPEARAGWEKSGAVITKHRARYGKKWNGWLTLKLLCA